jgi:hypothetical protein
MFGNVKKILMRPVVISDLGKRSFCWHTLFHLFSCLTVSQAHSVDEEDELPLGVEASINLDAFDPEDLDDEELVEGEDVLAPASIASSAFLSTVREV